MQFEVIRGISAAYLGAWLMAVILWYPYEYYYYRLHVISCVCVFCMYRKGVEFVVYRTKLKCANTSSISDEYVHEFQIVYTYTYSCSSEHRMYIHVCTQYMYMYTVRIS